MNAISNPLVSIVIPVYNGANYLDEAIRSALSQSYSNIEIIVVNDGSNDDNATEKIAQKYNDRIRYIHKENGGISSALNAGINAMRGEYFSWLSHDDLYEPEKIEKEVAQLRNSNDIVLCSGRQVDSEGKPIKHYSKTLDARLTPSQLFHNWLWDGYELNGLGFLIPKQALIACGLFDESLAYLQDLDMWIRLMFMNYSFICISDRLVISRVHRNQTTNLHKEVFFTDGAKMRRRHSLLLAQSNVDKRIIIDYMYLCAKDGTKEEVAFLRSLLAGQDCLPLCSLFVVVFFMVKGTLIRYARVIRDRIWTRKGIRN